MTVSMQPLLEFVDEDAPVLPGYTGAKAISGEWRGLAFLITVDHDGQVEASLSRTDKLRVRPGQSKAFFRFWGVTPFSGRLDMNISSHWVVQRGRLQ